MCSLGPHTPLPPYTISASVSVCKSYYSTSTQLQTHCFFTHQRKRGGEMRANLQICIPKEKEERPLSPLLKLAMWQKRRAFSSISPNTLLLYTIVLFLFAFFQTKTILVELNIIIGAFPSYPLLLLLLLSLSSLPFSFVILLLLPIQHFCDDGLE